MTKTKNPDIASPLKTNSRTGVIVIEKMCMGEEDNKYAPNAAKLMAPIDAKKYIEFFALRDTRGINTPIKNNIIPR